ncbi:MAG: hypothetical protein ABI824_11800 [Acidobacteriota bacterium]
MRPVYLLMNTHWAWPICETLHFFGLSLLIGSIGAFDLRLLGLAKNIPISAMHRFIRWGIFGYMLNICTGAMFLMAAPDQYIYNPSFHFKVLFMAVAGLNVLAFYSTMYTRVRTLAPGATAPLPARFMAMISLSMWIGVIIGGRMLTFYRPAACEQKVQTFPFYCSPIQ